MPTEIVSVRPVPKNKFQAIVDFVITLKKGVPIRGEVLVSLFEPDESLWEKINNESMRLIVNTLFDGLFGEFTKRVIGTTRSVPLFDGVKIDAED